MPGAPSVFSAHDHGGGTGALGHLLDLALAEVVRGEEHRDLPLLHQRDDLLHVAGRRRDARLGLDVVGAHHLEPLAEVGPFLVVAGHFLPPEHLALLEPAAQPVGERLALVLRRGNEVEELVAVQQVVHRGLGQHGDEVGADGGLEHPLLEVELARVKYGAFSGDTRVSPVRMLRAMMIPLMGSVWMCGLPSA